MLRALQGDSRTNILATPSVVTRDNQEAKMEVAQEVPFLTGQYSTTNGTGSAFQTIQREEVGTILTVTPTINEGDTVLLKLQVESSSLAASSQGAVDLITNKNAITTSVLIKDGGTLVLGGLIQDSVTNSEQSVPLLGNIPLIGELFRTRNTEKTKTNFLIFLQPHILRNDAQAGGRDRRQVRLHPRPAAHPRPRPARATAAALSARGPAAGDGKRPHQERHPQPRRVRRRPHGASKKPATTPARPRRPTAARGSAPLHRMAAPARRPMTARLRRSGAAPP